MNLRKPVILLQFLLFIALVSATGQDNPQRDPDSTLALSLSDAVELAREGNFDIRIAEHEADRANARFHGSSSIFLPRITLSESFISTNDPLTAFGLKLKQERISQADFNPVLLNNPPTTQNFTTKIEVHQPVINLDGFFGRHAASRASDAAREKLTRTRYGAELAVKKGYYGLVLAIRSLDVIEQSLDAASTYRDQARNFHDAGIIQLSDYLMADVRVLELEMKKVEADNSIRNAEDYLRHALGIGETVRLIPTDTLPLLEVDPELIAPGEISETRSDMKALRYGIDAATAGMRRQQTGFLPSLNAFASYELNNEALFDTEGRNWTVGAMISWNIFSGFDRIGRIQEAAATRSALETELSKMKSNSAREIDQAGRAVESAWKRIGLSSGTVRQATESLRVIEDRYAQGLERTSDLLSAEATLSNARLGYLETVYEHASAVFMLEFLLERKVTR